MYQQQFKHSTKNNVRAQFPLPVLISSYKSVNLSTKLTSSRPKWLKVKPLKVAARYHRRKRPKRKKSRFNYSLYECMSVL